MLKEVKGLALQKHFTQCTYRVNKLATGGASE